MHIFVGSHFDHFGFVSEKTSEIYYLGDDVIKHEKSLNTGGGTYGVDVFKIGKSKNTEGGVAM